MVFEGNILKMRSKLSSPVEYKLPIGEHLLDLNALIGKKVKLEFNGQINCIASGEKIKKSYNNGYSYKSFISLPECDICIVRPELCHYDKGTCRDSKWGEKHCMQDHIVYLANSSNAKIGITRHTQVPTRWIDQGAIEALPILRVPNRHISGLIESEIKNSIGDKTNWRKMLKGEVEEVDLYDLRDQLFEEYGDLLDEFDAQDLDEEITYIDFPLDSPPEKIKSLSFDKTPLILSLIHI